MPNHLHPFIGVFDSKYSVAGADAHPLKSRVWGDGVGGGLGKGRGGQRTCKKKKKTALVSGARCLQATRLQSSVTGLHTFYDTSSLCGNPLSPLGRQRGLSGCEMGLPQVPLGSRIRPELTNWQEHANTHTRTGCSTSTPAPEARPTLHKAVTLTPPTESFLLCFFFFPFPSLYPDAKIIFHPSSLDMLHGSFRNE